MAESPVPVPAAASSVALDRRRLLHLAGMSAGTWALNPERAAAADAPLKGRIRHSLVHWCFRKYWEVEPMCRLAVQLGCQSIELIAPEHWPTLKKHGLSCAIAGSHGFVQGMNNPKYHELCLAKLRQSIDRCAEAGFSTVITFTGFAEDSGPPLDGKLPDLAKLPANRPRIEPDEGVRNCVAGFKEIVGYAEKKKVNLALEMLNSRVDVEMKGHPGYQGDHIDYCLQILRQVGSPRLGLLFDVYHVQIMDGDLITRIRECKDHLFHIHTAGVPGRKELDDTQEINYAPVMQALVDVGYRGFVGHEFIPTRDAEAGLREAIRRCDV